MRIEDIVLQQGLHRIRPGDDLSYRIFLDETTTLRGLAVPIREDFATFAHRKGQVGVTHIEGPEYSPAGRFFEVYRQGQEKIEFHVRFPKGMIVARAAYLEGPQGTLFEEYAQHIADHMRYPEKYPLT